MGKKNCELSSDDIQRIISTFLDFKETEQSKIFPNAAFGYWKVTVERPLRLHSQFTRKAVEGLRFASGDEAVRRDLYSRFGQAVYDDFRKIKAEMEQALGGTEDDEEDEAEESSAKRQSAIPKKRLKKLLDPDSWKRDHGIYDAARQLWQEMGDTLFKDHNEFRKKLDVALKHFCIKLSAPDKKLILRAVSWRVEDALPVIAQVYKTGKAEADPLYGRYEVKIDGERCIVEYEPDSDLRDTEQVPLMEDGGIETFIRREVIPYTPDAWIKEDATKIGYEISFTRHFYKPTPLRTLDEIRTDIFAVEKETEGLLDELLKGSAK
jgi:type I restriction enzyme M protein